MVNQLLRLFSWIRTWSCSRTDRFRGASTIAVVINSNWAPITGGNGIFPKFEQVLSSI